MKFFLMFIVQNIGKFLTLICRPLQYTDTSTVKVSVEVYLLKLSL